MVLGCTFEMLLKSYAPNADTDTMWREILQMTTCQKRRVAGFATKGRIGSNKARTGRQAILYFLEMTLAGTETEETLEFLM